MLHANWVIRLSIAAALVSSGTFAHAQRAVVHEPDIASAIVRQFDSSDVIALTELHGSQADQDLRFRSSTTRHSREKRT